MAPTSFIPRPLPSPWNTQPLASETPRSPTPLATASPPAHGLLFLLHFLCKCQSSECQSRQSSALHTPLSLCEFHPLKVSMSGAEDLPAHFLQVLRTLTTVCLPGQACPHNASKSDFFKPACPQAVPNSENGTTVLESGLMRDAWESPFTPPLLCPSGPVICKAHQLGFQNISQTDDPLLSVSATTAEDTSPFHLAHYTPSSVVSLYRPCH